MRLKHYKAENGVRCESCIVAHDQQGENLSKHTRQLDIEADAFVDIGRDVPSNVRILMMWLYNLEGGRGTFDRAYVTHYIREEAI